jgi:hypothetical protein
MNDPLSHQMHGAMFGAASYMGMRYLLGQDHITALTRSLAACNLASFYMLSFGHTLPY